MAKAKPKFDAAASITNELIRIIERGVLPWRKPWTAGGSSRPLRVSGEPYQGVNNFLLTMRTTMAGYRSPFWMTMPQANALDARIRKGEKSSLVVYYGQSRKQGEGDDAADEGETDDARVFRFQKSYRVFNACQIEGLPDSFHPDPVPVLAERLAGYQLVRGGIRDGRVEAVVEFRQVGHAVAVSVGGGLDDLDAMDAGDGVVILRHHRSVLLRR